VHVVDHVELHTADYEQAKRFYEQALAPLGVAVLMEVKSDRTGLGVAAGFGRGQKPSFWLAKTERTTASVHLAFVAESRAAVDAFYEAALAAGGRDNGPPGLRPQYSAGYYAAFVFDLDGHNVEAVYRQPG
jgi:catechol 2,3-dioxygenase-like lactoylglutathione lyase family enzyme